MLSTNQHQIASTELSLCINTKGAELNSVIDKRSGFEFIWQAKTAIWNRNAPVLFPFVGKLNQNKFRVNSEIYPMTQHGFARDFNFELIELYKDTITLMLTDTEETLRIFPFNFKFLITYQVIKSAIKINYSIINTGTNILYFSVGAHPAFNLPVKDFSKFKIEFEKPENLQRHLLVDGLFSGLTENMGDKQRYLQLSNELFMKDAIVFKYLKSISLLLVQPGSNFKIKLNFKGFPYMGIWAKYPHQDFLCLEPWVGLADSKNFEKDLSQKEGIVKLSAGAEKHFAYKIKFTAP
nr:aldose 1-epimerase family protein [Pseudopedobacter sp.]